MDSIVRTTQAVPALLPRKELASLPVGESYHIQAMRLVDTRFGASIVVELDEPGVCPQTVDKKLFIYLPKRWSEVFTAEQLKSVVPCKLTLKVTGHLPLANNKISVQLQIIHVSTMGIWFNIY